MRYQISDDEILTFQGAPSPEIESHLDSDGRKVSRLYIGKRLLRQYYSDDESACRQTTALMEAYIAAAFPPFPKKRSPCFDLRPFLADQKQAEG